MILFVFTLFVSNLFVWRKINWHTCARRCDFETPISDLLHLFGCIWLKFSIFLGRMSKSSILVHLIVESVLCALATETGNSKSNRAFFRSSDFHLLVYVVPFRTMFSKFSFFHCRLAKKRVFLSMYLPCCGSRNNGDVRNTRTVMESSETKTALSSVSIVTVYWCSSEICFNWTGISAVTRFNSEIVGFSAHNTTNWTTLSPWSNNPERDQVDTERCKIGCFRWKWS